MSSPDIQRLREIKTFPSLVKYLRDELDWPIESEDFDELTFEYEPDELGIDAKTAVKIKDIKQLRPLSSKQPWGIFFINFEPKQLPIVVLRRILRSLVIKKRAYASKSQQAAWQLHDLLFISSYGETDHREITFAHFSEPTDRLFGDLPTLRVLGWDDDDTKLKIDYVEHTLSEKLRWPGDEDDTEAWRKNWSNAFELRPREVITTSKDLAVRLADLAKSIRQRANLILRIESERGPLRMLHKAFQTALIHDLSEDDFADMYAQTIAYGLLAARVSRPAGIIADNLADMIPTNPFLKDMLGIFLTVGGRKGKIDFDELGIQEVVDLLNNPDTHIEAVLRDFGKKTMQEDPVIHFYELFLNEYDKKKKVQRGVFYTPQPVVSYIVRSVHELLKTEFGLEDGLASIVTWGEMAKRNPNIKIPEGVSPDEPFVQILDPATGTATFLVEVIEIIYKTMTEKWLKEGHMALEIPKLWNKYVPKHLLPRLYGFELMMAPYAIAHMKIGLKLAETGYRFGSNERAHIYLTNSLEPPSDLAEQPQFEDMAPALAHEAKAVNAVKRNKRFTVVMGNPPYSKASQNLGDSFSHLIEQFRFFCSERIREPGAILFERDINNDYIKFMGLYRLLIESASIGLVGVITSNSYLDGKNFRGVRDALLSTFSEISIVNLHGDSRSGALARQGTHDENVFAIETGVSVAILVKKPLLGSCGQIVYAESTGTYETKCSTLFNGGSSLDWASFKVDPRLYFSFLPVISTRLHEYSTFKQMDKFFSLSVDGIKTSRDGLVIANTREECAAKIKSFMLSDAGTQDIEREFGISLATWDYKAAQRHLRKSFSEELIHRIAYRPLDFRYIYYDPELVFSHRMGKMIHMIKRKNIGLVCASRLSSKGFDNILPTDCLVEMKYASHDTNSRLFPLFLHGNSLINQTKDCNFNNEILDAVNAFKLDQHESWAIMIAAIFAIMNAPSYRKRYYEEIKNDFPSVPLIDNSDMQKELSSMGMALIQAQLLQVQVPVSAFPFYGKVGEPITTPVLDRQKLYLTNSGYFDGVSQELFEFHIAGYPVCKTWVSAGKKSGLQRKGRKLMSSDVHIFRSVLFAIQETIRIRTIIDKVIDAYGGWLDAFLTKGKKASSGYDVQPQPVLKAAEEISEYKKQKSSTTHPKVLPLKKDWRTWLALSQWAKETMRINSYWINFAHELGKSLKEGKQLTDKQKEDMGKCWQKAINKGFEGR